MSRTPPGTNKRINPRPLVQPLISTSLISLPTAPDPVYRYGMVTRREPFGSPGSLLIEASNGEHFVCPRTSFPAGTAIKNYTTVRFTTNPDQPHIGFNATSHPQADSVSMVEDQLSALLAPTVSGTIISLLPNNHGTIAVAGDKTPIRFIANQLSADSVRPQPGFAVCFSTHTVTRNGVAYNNIYRITVDISTLSLSRRYTLPPFLSTQLHSSLLSNYLTLFIGDFDDNFQQSQKLAVFFNHVDYHQLFSARTSLNDVTLQLVLEHVTLKYSRLESSLLREYENSHLTPQEAKDHQRSNPTLVHTRAQISALAKVGSRGESLSILVNPLPWLRGEELTGALGPFSWKDFAVWVNQFLTHGHAGSRGRSSASPPPT